MNRAHNHNTSYLALITLINKCHMPHFKILAESICQENDIIRCLIYTTTNDTNGANNAYLKPVIENNVLLYSLYEYIMQQSGMDENGIPKSIQRLDCYLSK